MLVALASWRGLISGRADDHAVLSLVAITAPGGQSWASPFRGIADDGHDYFVKTLEGCKRHWARGSLAVEYIVGQVGKLIGAPVCENTLIRIPAEFADHEITSGIALSPGIANASKAIEHVEEQRDYCRMVSRAPGTCRSRPPASTGLEGSVNPSEQIPLLHRSLSP